VLAGALAPVDLDTSCGQPHSLPGLTPTKRSSCVVSPQPALEDIIFIEGYAEDVNEDALTNAWLDKSTSYIYKVGCLRLFDDNKRDFGWAFVGIERDPGDFQYLGSLYFRDGENTDCGRVMRRVLACLAGCDIVFQDY
jgi:hypothetical protein